MILTGCDTPGPHFRDVAPQRVVVNGSAFDVRVRGNLAEAIRTNAEYAPRLGRIADRARVAIEQVSACPVREVRGDQAYVVGILECGQKGRASRSSDVGDDYECATIDVFRRSSTHEVVLELDCTSI